MQKRERRVLLRGELFIKLKYPKYQVGSTEHIINTNLAERKENKTILS
jgi:hypothetical protein